MTINPSSLYIGLMSGTSLDGVDGALVDFASGAIATLAAHYVPFSAALRAQLMALQTPGENEIEREAMAANALAERYAECISALLSHAGLAAQAIQAVGAHGQTIRHRPDLGFTRQTNNPALLAEISGIDIVADFRSRDIAAGGQGAPLVPAFHRVQFGKAGQTRVLVNIGGISNISVLHGDGSVVGFDTGPGNVLMDAWIARQKGKNYDEDGAWAATGKVHQALLAVLLEEPYFSLPAPKSTGRDLFHTSWLDARLALFDALTPADVQATLTALTAQTITCAIRRYGPGADAVYVCGGGAYNGMLLQEMALQLQGQATVESTAALGVAPNRVEALAFAWLAYRFTRREPGNLAAVTGAKGDRILGALYPGNA